MVVCAIVLLPVLASGLLGFAIPASWSVKVAGTVAYIIVLVSALARHVDYRIRVWSSVGAGYLFALLGSAAFPQAPFLRALPLEHAIFVLVLTGAKSGRIATVISLAIILLIPFLHTAPGIMPFLTDDSATPHTSFSLAMVQSINLATLMVGLMLLLDRFHSMLLRVLADQQQTADTLRSESAERADAVRKLEFAITERQRLERELARISDEERRRLGQDVHDGICQQLTSALLRCQTLERRLARADALTPSDMHALSSLLEDAIDEAHVVAQGLQPLEPEPEALVHALHTLAKQTQAATGLACHLAISGETAVPDLIVAQHLYRIAQEAVNNAVRHAHASHLHLTFSSADHAYTLYVEDDGGGLPTAPVTSGLGMRTMAYRAEVIGGTLTIDASSHGGVRVTCRAPMSSVIAVG